ncbi:MAG: substrate-binding domain-containing protein [Shewanella fodinae]|nr:substrate-binding domain-containing protein [Shewanella fodinae]
MLLAAILSLGSYAAEAAVKLKVITSGGFAGTLTAMEPQLEKDTGLDIDISYGSSSGGAVDSIPERLKRGEQFDVLILSRSSLDKLTNKDFVSKDTRTDLVRSRIGMCVKKGQNRISVRQKTSLRCCMKPKLLAIPPVPAVLICRLNCGRRWACGK